MTGVYAIVVLAGIGGALALLLVIADRFLAHYGPCTIRVNEEDPFTMEGGITLLNALYAQRIFIPSACGGQGTCGFCKVNIRSGGGPVLPTELPYLTKKEIAADTRLACQVKVKEDLLIHVRADYLNVQEFTAEVTGARLVTHDTREIHLRLIEPSEIGFEPGQYVQVRVPSKDVFRAYSISSQPSRKNDIELLVRLIPGGLGSTYLHNVQPGEEVAFTGPYGEFELAGPETELVCVGGGCGMAPMRSLIRHAAETSPERKCSLYFGARTAEDAMYAAEFAALAGTMPNLRVHYALSEPDESPEWTGETGFIHTVVAKHMAGAGARQAFLCGPPLMIEATMGVLKEKGLPPEMIFYDEF